MLIGLVAEGEGGEGGGEERESHSKVGTLWVRQLRRSKLFWKMGDNQIGKIRVNEA